MQEVVPSAYLRHPKTVELILSYEVFHIPRLPHKRITIPMIMSDPKLTLNLADKRHTKKNN